MSRIPVTPNASVRARRNGRDIEVQQKVGPGPWVYVGDWPDEAFTTYWSPPWQNDFINVTGRRVKFRHGLDGSLEFAGQYDLTAGAVTGTVAFTLPEDWLGESLDFHFPIYLGDGVWISGVQSVNGVTGDVTIYWPVQADPLA